jgi:hypothetical protein
MAREVLTTHHLKLEPREASETIDRLRTALPSYAAELEGLISAALYYARNKSDVLLVGRWDDFAAVVRSLEWIYARPEFSAGVYSGEFNVYSLVDEVRSEAA